MSRRPQWIVWAGLPLAAAALWGSSRLSWGSEVRPVPGTGGTTVVVRTGAEAAPLVPVALLALAGLAAAVALGGWPRRLVGGVLAAGGVTVIGYALFATHPQGELMTGGRVLALVGGAGLLAGGLMLAWLSGRLPRLGSRYQVSRARTGPDNGDSDMWRSLSQGEDPTTD